MLKTLIIKGLKQLVNESTTPGISVTADVNKKNKKINDGAMSDAKKQQKEIDKASAKEDINQNTMAVNKFGYTDEVEEEYHEDMEIRNGLEMLKYDRDPGANFKDRAKKSIVGDSTMGNAASETTESTWNASDDEFAEKFMDSTKRAGEKRAEAELTTFQLGNDIELAPQDMKDKKTHLATEKGGKKGAQAGKSSSPKLNENITHVAVLKENNQTVKQWDYTGKSKEELINNKQQYFGESLKKSGINPSTVTIKRISK